MHFKGVLAKSHFGAVFPKLAPAHKMLCKGVLGKSHFGDVFPETSTKMAFCQNTFQNCVLKHHIGENA